MTFPIAPWQRPAFRSTGRDAATTLIASADENVLAASPGLRIREAVPQNASISALDLRVHQYADSPAWIDGWRAGALRNLALAQLDDVERLDTASCCYSITVTAEDPPDLTHLHAGHKLRFDGRPSLTVTPYLPDATTPELNLNNDVLLRLVRIRHAQHPGAPGHARRTAGGARST